MSRVSTKSESAKKKKPARASSVSAWQNRIVSFDPAVDPEQLLAHPDNWRIHTLGQRAVLEGVLDSVGWVAPVIVNVQTSHTLDGHQRIESAITKGEKVPVMYVDVTEAEEKAILATFDPIGALAVRDAEKHDALLAEMGHTHTALVALLSDAQALTHSHPPASSGDDAGSSSASLSSVTSQAAVIVLCADEDHQRQVYEQLVGLGLTCKTVNA